MQAEAKQLETMLEMQQIDLSVLQMKKKLQTLPQRAKILQVREKRAALKEKEESVRSMHADAKRKLSRVMDEDALLQEKMANIQAIIDSARGDYRAVESRAKELDGIAKRRATLADDIGAFGAEEAKASALSKQIEEMLAQLDAQEEKLVASFKAEGGALQQGIAQQEARRMGLIATLPSDLQAAYEKAAQRCGGVAIGVLKDDLTCSVCRSVIEEPRLLEIRSKRPLAECPYCHRLLCVR